MRVSDGGIPPKSSTAVATVSVNRNLNSPQFSTDRVDITLLETNVVGVPFTNCNASDADTKVCSQGYKYTVFLKICYNFSFLANWCTLIYYIVFMLYFIYFMIPESLQ